MTLPAARGALLGTGPMADLIRNFDWSATSLGPIDGWPATIKTVVAMILRAPLPIVTLWGEDGVMIYNDAYSAFAGSRHPAILGSRVREGWVEVADFNDNVIRTVFRGGGTLSYEDQELTLDRGRGPEQVWLNLDYSQVVDEDGTPLGVVAMVVETTDKVAIDRQLRDERIRLRQMYDQSASFMALLEGPNHRFSIVNPAYVQLVGGREVVGQTLAEALPEAVEQGFGAILDQVYATGQPYLAHGAGIDLLTPDSDRPVRRHVDFIYQPISDSHGRVTSIFVNGIDVTDGMAVQDALRLSEAKFRSFAEVMPNQAWTATPDGRLDWFNERVAEYSGLPLGSLLGRGWTSIVHPEDLPGAVQIWSEALAAGQPYQTEFRIRRRDGIYRWHLVRAQPVRDEGGELLRWIGTNTDIQEQKQAEANSLRDRDRLWSLSQDIMLIARMDGTILAINPSATRLLGWREDEMVGQPIARFVHPEDLDETSDELSRLSRGMKSTGFENRYLCRDGAVRILAWTAVPDSGLIHAIGRDITESRRLSRDRDRIWNLSPVLKVVMDPDGIISAVSPAWSKTLGWTEGETIGRNVLDFVDPVHREGSAERLKQLGAQDQMMRSESTLLTATGESRVLAWTAVSEGGTLYAFGRDITTETETAAALQQAQKMEALGQLTGGIAHDFNNLLQVVSGNLQLLSRDLPPESRGALRVQNAMEGVQRGSRLASQLLAFGRRQPLAPKVVNLVRLLRGMDEMLRRALGEAIQIDLVVGAQPWNTRIDPGNVETALLNLAINGRDAMEGRGKLTIEVGNMVADAAWLRDHPDVAPGDYVMLSVTDTGSGMTPEVLSRAFEPFFTTKPEGRGTGLGLSMVYGFVQQSGGHVSVTSAPGQGTTVRLLFPRVELAEDAVAEPVEAVVSGGKETILVAEDDAAVRETVVETLSDMGYRVLQAPDARSALAVVASGIPIDLLFTDVVMPGPLKANELAQRAVQHQPRLKVLFTSGYAQDSIVHDGKLDEGVELLSKPYEREALASRIRQLLDPAPAAPAPAAGSAPAGTGPAAGAALRILVCEDDSLIRMALAGMLEDMGHAVIEAGRASEALRHLKEAPVDLLITDLGLPDMNGAQLATEARAADAGLPVIFATGHDAVEGFARDARTQILTKPFNEAMLASMVASVTAP